MLVQFLQETKPILPELFLFGSLITLFGISTIVATSTAYNSKYHISSIATSKIVILLLILTAILVVLPIDTVGTYLFTKSLYIDFNSRIFKLLILITTIIILLVSFDYYRRDNLLEYEYPILIGFVVLGMMVMLSSHNFLVFYLSIELQTLSMYVLICFRKTSRIAVEASLKFFILGSLSSILLVFGISFLYGTFGTLNFSEIHDLIFMVSTHNHYDTSLVIGLAFILIGLLFKLTVAPFHMWAPDVYEGAPIVTTFFMATVSKIAFLGIFIKIFYTICNPFFWVISPALIVFGLLSIIVGSIGAIYQRKLKRLAAYSSIGHMGFILLSLSTGTLSGVHYAILYLFIYVLMSICFFTILISVQRGKNYKRLEYLTDLLYLNDFSPVISMIFAIVLFSMAGVPPLLGFWSKFYVLSTIIDQGMFYIALAVILLSSISAFYYIRLIKVIFFEKTKKTANFHNVNTINFAVIMLAAASLFIFPTTVYSTILHLNLFF